MQRRLTDEERSAVSVVMFWQRKLEAGGITASEQKVCEQMLLHNTTDGLPFVEPPLTEADAIYRVLVMIRANEGLPWTGPATLVGCLEGSKAKYLVVWPDKKSWSSCMQCRRATPEEIAAAGLDTPDA